MNVGGWVPDSKGEPRGGSPPSAVLVTGGAGFLGRALIRRLQESGARITAVYHHTAPPELPVAWRRCPLGDPGAVADLFREARPEVVYHLAGTRGGSGSPGERLQRLYDANLASTQTLLSACLALGRPTFVLAGSSEEYGDGPVPLGEDAAVCPTTPYGASKLSATLLTQHYGRLAGLNACSARIFLAYGPGQGLDFFLPQLLQARERGEPFAMSPGQQTRDFVWVDDCVEALVRLGGHPALQGQIVNVCTGRETRLADLPPLVAELGGRPVEARVGALSYRPGEMMRNVGDPSRLKELTGFRPTTALPEGLARLLALA